MVLAWFNMVVWLNLDAKSRLIWMPNILNGIKINKTDYSPVLLQLLLYKNHPSRRQYTLKINIDKNHKHAFLTQQSDQM